jgi:hypothetical protein
LSHASKLKRIRHIGIQQKTSSAWSKTHVGDLKDGAVMIPFIECLWDHTCLPKFKFSIDDPFNKVVTDYYWVTNIS